MLDNTKSDVAFKKKNLNKKKKIPGNVFLGLKCCFVGHSLGFVLTSGARGSIIILISGYRSQRSLYMLMSSSVDLKEFAHISYRCLS